MIEKDSDSYNKWYLPDEVVEILTNDVNSVIVEQTDLFLVSTPPNLDAYKAHMPEWYSGSYLENFATFIDDVQAGKYPLQTGQFEACFVELVGCDSSDECDLYHHCENGTLHYYDFATGELGSRPIARTGSAHYIAKYDQTSSRWKVDHFLSRTPPLFETPSIPVTHFADQSSDAACVQVFESHGLVDTTGQADRDGRRTLATDELRRYQGAMGITSMCIPPELGSPFVNTDWNAADMSATTGRMLSIGFENLYDGSGGWSDGAIVYATYDFVVGAEYDTHATTEDYTAVQNGSKENIIEVNGVKGFLRIGRSDIPPAPRIQKAVVFPFETHYVAVVYDWWWQGWHDLAYVDETDKIVLDLYARTYPESRRTALEALDTLTTIQFD